MGGGLPPGMRSGGPGDQDRADYIPHNLISVTDRQIYLAARIFRGGILLAVDVGGSVSRGGGKTQLPAYKAVAADLRLSYSQFEELEAFSRFGTSLEEETLRTLERGRRVRETLKQNQYRPLPVPEQIAMLLAVTRGHFDGVPLREIEQAKRAVAENFRRRMSEMCRKIETGKELSPADVEAINERVANSVKEISGGSHADS